MLLFMVVLKERFQRGRGAILILGYRVKNYPEGEILPSASCHFKILASLLILPIDLNRDYEYPFNNSLHEDGTGRHCANLQITHPFQSCIGPGNSVAF